MSVIGDMIADFVKARTKMFAISNGFFNEMEYINNKHKKMGKLIAKSNVDSDSKTLICSLMSQLTGDTSFNSNCSIYDSSIKLIDGCCLTDKKNNTSYISSGNTTELLYFSKGLRRIPASNVNKKNTIPSGNDIIDSLIGAIDVSKNISSFMNIFKIHYIHIIDTDIDLNELTRYDGSSHNIIGLIKNECVFCDDNLIPIMNLGLKIPSSININDLNAVNKYITENIFGSSYKLLSNEIVDTFNKIDKLLKSTNIPDMDLIYKEIEE